MRAKTTAAPTRQTSWTTSERMLTDAGGSSKVAPATAAPMAMSSAPTIAPPRSRRQRDPRHPGLPAAARPACGVDAVGQLRVLRRPQDGVTGRVSGRRGAHGKRCSAAWTLAASGDAARLATETDTDARRERRSGRRGRTSTAGDAGGLRAARVRRDVVADVQRLAGRHAAERARARARRSPDRAWRRAPRAEVSTASTCTPSPVSRRTPWSETSQLLTTASAQPAARSARSVGAASSKARNVQALRAAPRGPPRAAARGPGAGSASCSTSAQRSRRPVERRPRRRPRRECAR